MNPLPLVAKTKTLMVTVTGLVILATDLFTIGGVIVAVGGLVVAAIVGYFTIRNLQRSYWRNLVDERDAEILEMKRLDEEKLQERAAFAEEQRELRHRLKGEIANLQGQLQLERAKSDLTVVFAQIASIETILKAHEPVFDEINIGIRRQSELMAELVGHLKNT